MEEDSSDLVLGSWPLLIVEGAAGASELRVVRNSFRGRWGTHLRVYQKVHGTFRPTKQGARVRDQDLPEVISALQQALQLRDALRQNADGDPLRKE